MTMLGGRGATPVCTRFNRRAALQIGAGLLGLSLPDSLRRAHAEGIGGPNVSCIFIFLAGGASQYETFDPKPHAPIEIRGLWSPIQTNVPGVSICEKLPLLAQRMDKVALIRSWQGRDGGHDTGTQHVASGFLPARTGQYFPNFGCLISALYGSQTQGMPAHLGLPVAVRYTNPPGYLGSAHNAFNIKGDPRSPELEFNKLNLSPVRFENRRSMLTQLENLGQLTELEGGSLTLMTSSPMKRSHC